MRMNALIPMQAQGVDVVGSMARGAEARGQMQQAQTQNALTQFMQEQGPALARGEQGAIDGYARFDPAGAFDMRSRINEAARVAQEQAAAAAEKLDAQQRAAEEANINRILSIVGTAYRQGPEAIEAAKAQYGQALAQANIDPTQLTYDTIPLFVAGLVGAKNGLKAGLDASEALQPKPEKPADEYQRYAQEERNDGREPLSRIEYAQAKRGNEEVYDSEGNLIFRRGGNNGGGFTSPPPSPETLPPPPEGGEEAFGFEGAAKNLANTVSDLFGYGEVFENAAEQTRFFKALEEDMLVGLSQAYGRQPAQALMERLRSLVPNAGTIEGPDRAFGELQALEQRFLRDLRTWEGQMQGRMSQNDRADIRGKILGVKSTLAAIQEAKQRLRPNSAGSGNTTSSGVTWSVVE